MPIGRYIPGKVEVDVEKKLPRYALDLRKKNVLLFFCLLRQRSTFDSLCLGARTSTLPRLTKTWPTPHMCISTARGNSTMLCEF